VGELDPIDGWISTAYGRRQPAPSLAFATHAQLPLSIVTVLRPVRVRSEPPHVECRTDGVEHWIGVGDTGDSVVIGADELQVVTRAQRALER
jgi:hypothetical protein